MKKILLTIIVFVSALTIAYSQCTKPAIVAIAIPASSTMTICQGSTQVLVGAVTVTGASQNGGFTYSWIKTTGTGTGVKVASSPIVLPANVTTNVPAYAGITGMLADAGTYTLRVEDGNVGNAACYTEATVSIIITPPVISGVISADQTICTGSVPVILTGSQSAGGTTFKYYKWQRSIGTATGPWISTTAYSSTGTNHIPTPVISDTYYRRIDSSGVCAPAPTNVVKITTTPLVNPSVTISSTPSTTICEGTPVTFTATPANGGTTPVYVWTSSVNGALSSTTNTYTSTGLVNGEIISVEMTSSIVCASPSKASAAVTMTVAPRVVPTVSIVSDKTTSCPGEGTTFSIASQSNTGTAPTYQWRKNNSLIAGATNSTYTSHTIVNGDIFDVVMTTTLPCVISPTATSNSISITINPIPTINVSVIPSMSSICYGSAVVFTSTIVGTGTTPAPTYEWFITNNATATGGVSQGAPSTTASTFTTTALTATNNKVYVKVVSNAACAQTTPVASNVVPVTINTGINPGTIGTDQIVCYNGVPAAITELTPATGITGSVTYVWEASLDGVTAWVTLLASGSGYTFPTGLTQDVYIRRIITDAGAPAPCNVATSNVVHITVRPQLTAGVISGDQTICANSPTSAITSTSLPTGGFATSTYVWESSVSANTGSFSSVNPAATGTSYSAGALNATTYFRRKEINICGTVYSNVVTKTVTVSEVVTASINEPGQICAGSPSIPFIATASTTGTGTLNYQWFIGSLLVGTNSPNYSYTPFIGDDNKIVKVVVTTSASCNAGPAVSNLVTLDIFAASTPTVTATTSGNNSTCAGLPTRFTATSTGGGLTPTYQWYIIPAGGSMPGNPVGTNSSTFIGTSLQAGDRVYVELISSLVCLSASNPFVSNIITLDIKPVPTPTILEGDQTVCSPNSFTFHGVIISGNTATWVSMPSNTVVSTGIDFTASQSGTYALLEDNGICNVLSMPVQLTVISTAIANAGPDQHVLKNSLVTLNASGGNEYSWSPSTYLSNTTIANPTFTADQTITYTVTVSDASGICSSQDDVTIHVSNAPAGSFSTAITGPNPITIGQQNAQYSVPNQTGFTYTWTVTGGTIVSGQNTNSVMVDWNAPTSNAFARTTAETYSISVLEKNTSNQTQTTSLNINTISTGTTLSQAQAGINVFPNPTTGSFSIAMPQSGMNVTYEILDVTGLSVASGTFTSTGSDQKIDANFGAGMYQIILKYDNVVTCARLSKVQ